MLMTSKEIRLALNPEKTNLPCVLVIDVRVSLSAMMKTSAPDTTSFKESITVPVSLCCVCALVAKLQRNIRALNKIIHFK